MARGDLDSPADFLVDYVERNLDRLLDASRPHVVVYRRHTEDMDLAFFERYKSKAHYASDMFYWSSFNYQVHAEWNFGD